MDSRPSNRASDVPRGAPSRWRAVVSGQAAGLGPALARAGLAVLAGGYRAGLAAANLARRLGGTPRRAPCPVISVGNLTVGGTGKTPMVAYLATLLAAEGYRPLIASRGYGAEGGAANEEAAELALRCPQVPHVQDPDRLRAIRDAAASGEAFDVAILDDGFQHRRLARDLDIILLDALCPFGHGHLLPRGLLREPPTALHRADVVVVTRADLVDPAALADIKAAAGHYAAPGTPVLTAEHRPAGVVFADGSRAPADWLDGRTVAAACGIGNPEAFRRTLERLGAPVARFDAFRDHHAYTADEVSHLRAAARDAGAAALVTTAKDFVKWRPLLADEAAGEATRESRAAAAVRIAALEVAMHLVDGEDVLRRRVLDVLPEPRPGGDR
ncbi:MAG: tetraacyldisaccharide 4'-kinase [Phycisphaerae bacterium]